MSSHLAEPGEMIEETVASTFAAVPEVPVSKRAIRRTARLGKPATEDDGEVPLLAALTDALGAWKRWKDSRTANTLKGSFQTGHDRRGLTLVTFVQGTGGTYSALSEGEGRSSSQDTRWWRISMDLSTSGVRPAVSTRRRFATSVRYSTNATIPGGVTDVTVDVLGGTATITDLFYGPGTIRFVIENPNNHPEVVLRIRATEVREYGPTGSGLPTSSAVLDQVVVANMKNS